MDVSPEEVLIRRQHCGWTMWGRRFDFRSFRRVYAVYVCREKDECIVDPHKVRGILASGQHFAAYLVKSQIRKHSLTAISNVYGSGFKDDKTGGHWVIVKADSESEAASHEDVLLIKNEIMKPSVSDVFCGVYFISNGIGAVKIGRTTCNVRHRISQLQSTSAYKLYACALIDTQHHKALERSLHREWKALRMEGEWFQMSDEKAAEIAVSHGGRVVCVRPYSKVSNLPMNA
jgi:hypothetical protein